MKKVLLSVALAFGAMAIVPSSASAANCCSCVCTCTPKYKFVKKYRWVTKYKKKRVFCFKRVPKYVSVGCGCYKKIYTKKVGTCNRTESYKVREPYYVKVRVN